MRYFIKLALLLLPLGLGAQTVTITGTVVGSNGSQYTNGTGRAVLVSGNGSGQQAWTINGTNPVNTVQCLGGLDGFGKFTCPVTNTSLIDQQTALPQWQFEFNSSSANPSGFVSCTVPPLSLATSQDISTQIAATPCPIVPGGGNINLSSPPPIGNVTPNTGQFTQLNGVMNAATFTGSDIGAKINAAIAACSGGNTCTVWLPQGSYSYSTTITLPAGIILECASRTSGDFSTMLNYTGSGAAIAMSGYGSQVKNCGIVLGPSATYGINMTGYRGIVDSVYLEGGGNSTTGIRLGGNILMVTNTTMWAIAGIGVECDNAIDLFLNNIDIYGTNNTTGAGYIIDSACAGIQLNAVSSGGSNLHGLWVRNTLTGGTPSHIFANQLITDCATGDGWLFDANLNASLIQANFVNSWSAGSGLNCNTSNTVNAHKAGVHISGGTGYNFIGGMYRNNTGSGFLIDNIQVQGVGISGAQILSNNINNDGTESGVDVTAAITGLSIVGNTCTNAIDFRGHQNYCVNASSAAPNIAAVTGNIAYTNSVGNYLFNAATVFSESPPFRMQIPSGTQGIYTYPKSDADLGEYALLGFNAAQSSVFWDITKGGNATFSNGVIVGKIGGSNGQITFNGMTSGSAALVVPAVAGTPTITLPTTSGILAVSSTVGFTGTKTAGTCIFTISNGIITNVTGC